LIELSKAIRGLWHSGYRGTGGLLALAVVALLVASESGHAQDYGVAGDVNLQQVIESIRSDNQLPALVAVLVHDGEIVEMAATGRRAVGFDELVTADDVWHVGSLTKAMTATLAPVLVERGDLSWDTTIGAVFPELVGTMNEEYEDVRLEELLYHTAALPVDVLRAPSWASLRADTAAMTVQRYRFAVELLGMSSEGERGEFQYSNAGYIVAGAMLERVTGLGWEELLAVEMFVPLGMGSCGFGAPGDSSRDEPWGHRGKAGSWLPVEPGPYADNPLVLGPAGTVHCSGADYARYMIEQLAGAAGVDGLVSAASFQVLHTPPAGSVYAMGWGVGARGWAGGRVLNHHGSNTMWWASVWLAPERGLGLFAAVNAGGDDAFKGADAAVAALIARFEAAASR
jgi:CubicO group peptidase (beta-lactamase class C family)